MSRSGSPDHKRRKLDREQPEGVGLARMYLYEKLEGDNDIRLIALLPGPFHGIVRFEFITCDLNDPPDYEALSYTWANSDGDQSLNGTAWCEPGCRKILVTRNCEDALRRLRLQREARFLWVDAISINQTAIPERNRQVSMMPRIYHLASRVIVYLGEATAGTNEFMDRLNRGQLNSQLGFERSIPPGLAIFSRRWFQRLWILQEISRARAANIMCGNRITPWKRLLEYYTCVFSRSARDRDFQHLRAVFEYGLRGVIPMDELPNLFVDSSLQSCSDPRDRVFALLGIVAQDGPLTMTPEYGASNGWVFKQIAVLFLTKFNILFADEGFTLPSEDWSSWVFNWSQQRKRPSYSLTVDNLVSFSDRGGNFGILEIAGRMVMHGNVCRGSLEGRWSSIEVREGFTFVGNGLVEGVIVVEVSRGFCVLLLRYDEHYALVGEVTDFQRCEKVEEGVKQEKAHNGPGQCTPMCPRHDLHLTKLGIFSIL